MKLKLAEWGNGWYWVDVTARVRHILDSNEQIYVNAYSLRATPSDEPNDPVPGTPKHLQLFFEDLPPVRLHEDDLLSVESIVAYTKNASANHANVPHEHDEHDAEKDGKRKHIFGVVSHGQFLGWLVAVFVAMFTPYFFKWVDFPQFIYIPALIICAIIFSAALFYPPKWCSRFCFHYVIAIVLSILVLYFAGKYARIAQADHDKEKKSESFQKTAAPVAFMERLTA